MPTAASPEIFISAAQDDACKRYHNDRDDPEMRVPLVSGQSFGKADSGAVGRVVERFPLGIDVSFTEKVFDASSDSESVEAATYHHINLTDVVGEDVFGDVKPRELGLLHILVRKPGLEGVRSRATIMGDGALHWLPAQSLHEHTCCRAASSCPRCELKDEAHG